MRHRQPPPGIERSLVRMAPAPGIAAAPVRRLPGRRNVRTARRAAPGSCRRLPPSRSAPVLKGDPDGAWHRPAPPCRRTRRRARSAARYRARHRRRARRRPIAPDSSFPAGRPRCGRCRDGRGRRSGRCRRVQNRPAGRSNGRNRARHATAARSAFRTSAGRPARSFVPSTSKNSRTPLT